MGDATKRELMDDDIASSISELRKSLEKEELPEREITHYTMMAGGILQRYQQNVGTSASFEMNIRKVFGHPQIRIKVYSAPFDYREKGNSKDERVLSRLTLVLNSAPAWTYRNDCNVVTIVMEKKRTIPVLVQVLVAAVLAFLTYPLLGFLPGGITVAVSQTIAPELTSIVLGILCFIIAMAAPAVPGGMVSVMTILTSQMVMPDGALGLFILVYMLTNNIITGYAVFTMQIEMVGLACRDSKVATA